MTEQVKSSFCRYCSALCAIEVTVRDGRATKVIGDAADPVYHGYTCIKGRQLPQQHNSPDRLLHSLRREPDGSFTAIPSTQAFDEIAGRIRDILDEHGPRSIAVYQGTHGMAQPVAAAMSDELMRAIGSPMIFNPVAIDQPGKILATGMHGRWHGGTWHLHQLDTLMLVGTNPVVSMWGGTFVYNPTRQFREAKARGMKLIVVDPRVTETAAFADLHLRPRPGEDATVIAGLLRAIITSGRHDGEFIDRHAKGFEALRRAVDPFDPDYVERRTGVPAADLVTAAHLLSSTRRGASYAGTGTDMARRGTLSEYLITSLFTVCGHFLREGDPVANAGTLLPPRTFEARAVAAKPTWDVGESMRSVPLRGMKGSMPTAQMADEILFDGPDRIRVLINWAGNPLVAIPDQLKLTKAFDALDLLVSIDPRMTATARRSHYVIAPKLSLEMPSVTWFHERSEAYLYPTANAYPMPYVHYTPTIVDPPEGSDVIDDWTFFHGLAARLGITLPIGGRPVDPVDPPTSEELLEQIFAGSVVPFSAIAASD
ncbi:MAG: molybdopterin-dependent oxidoreductase [Acidimicrobiia bacterium]